MEKKLNRHFRVDFLLLGVIAGLIASYFFRPSFLGMSPGFLEWYTEGIKHEAARSTIVVSAAIGGVIGFVADRFFEVQRRKSE